MLKIKHGSHLYGLNHAESDLDIYQVLPGRFKTKQTIIDGIDTTTISYSNFMKQAGVGVPQALEAMFASGDAVLEDEIEFIRSSFVARGNEVIDRYIRTIYNFSLGEYKQRRHALRLAFNLTDLIQHGRFDPTCTFARRMEMQSVLAMPYGFWSTYIERLTGYEFFDRMDKRRERRGT